MINKEKEILEIYSDFNENICNNFIEPIVLKQYGTFCNQCKTVCNTWINKESKVTDYLVDPLLMA